jgi:hypothetical protein
MSADTDGTWTRTSSAGTQQPIAALTPDAIDRLEKNPAWQEICQLAEKEITAAANRILDPSTPDEEANRLRRGLVIARAASPASLIATLRIRHPRT